MKYFTATALIIFTVLGISSFTYGFENQTFLQVGVGAGYTSLSAKKNDSTYESLNLAVHSQFGYRHEVFEYGFFSNVYLGNTKDIYIASEDRFISGDGWLSGTDIGFYCKYFLPVAPVSGWSPYIFLGPQLSLRTLRFDEYETNFAYDDSYKITFNSKGGQIRLGIEQKIKKKKETPIFVELVYSYMKKYKGSVVDVSDYTYEEILGTADLENLGYYTYSFMVNIGFALL